MFSNLEGPHGAPIEGDEFIVLPGRVAFAARFSGAAHRSDGLRRMGLEAGVQVKSAGQLEIAEQIEFVTLVAVRKTVIQSRDSGVEAAVCEGIALVRVGV